MKRTVSAPALLNLRMKLANTFRKLIDSVPVVHNVFLQDDYVPVSRLDFFQRRASRVMPLEWRTTDPDQANVWRWVWTHRRGEWWKVLLKEPRKNCHR